MSSPLAHRWTLEEAHDQLQSSRPSAATGALRTTDTGAYAFETEQTVPGLDVASPRDQASGFDDLGATPDPWGTDAATGSETSLGGVGKEGLQGVVAPTESTGGADAESPEAAVEDEPSTLIDDDRGLMTDALALDPGDLDSLVTPDLGDVIEP